jgi:hypothetical protein
VNVSLKYFKDNYDQIIDEITKTQQEKQKKRKAFEKKQKLAEKDVSEELVLEKVPIPERKKEDLVDIMSELEEITGEHYELSIDLEEEETEPVMTGSSLGYQQEDIDKFEKGFPKKAIWHGKPTKAFIEWLEKKK